MVCWYYLRNECDIIHRLFEINRLNFYTFYIYRPLFLLNKEGKGNLWTVTRYSLVVSINARLPLGKLNDFHPKSSLKLTFLTDLKKQTRFSIQFVYFLTDFRKSFWGAIKKKFFVSKEMLADCSHWKLKSVLLVGYKVNITEIMNRNLTFHLRSPASWLDWKRLLVFF